MGRNKKVEAEKTVETENLTEESKAMEETQEPIAESTVETENVEIEEVLPKQVLESMRLYPQYKKIWITSKGFVHPEGAPKYLLKDAKLYNNKFYNEKY